VPVTSSYPVNLVLTNLSCLVVGGGTVAARKVEGLLAAGARVTVVAPEAVPALTGDPRVRWHQRPYRRGEVASYRLAVAATGDPAVNGQVHRDADAAGIFVNSADDPERCTFTLPAVVRRGQLQVTVSTAGHSPAVARWLRRRIERELGDGIEGLLAIAGEVRAEARAAFGTSELPAWDEALDDEELLGLVTIDPAAARDRLRRRLGLLEVQP
jgi:precorrin-2 dehydrogenase / sirohydrochlorin ferrochelatase